MGASTPACSILHYHAFQTQLGLMLLALEEGLICFLHFGPSREALHHALQESFPQASIMPCTDRYISIASQIETLVHSLISGHSVDEHPTLLLKGTPFQQRVWSYLQTIPYGEVRSYADVARAIGQPQAVRAAASACARNAIALLIPCHRVVRGDGALSGYRWGVHKKASLLETEKRGLIKTPLPTTTA